MTKKDLNFNSYININEYNQNNTISNTTESDFKYKEQFNPKKESNDNLSYSLSKDNFLSSKPKRRIISRKK